MKLKMLIDETATALGLAEQPDPRAVTSVNEEVRRASVLVKEYTTIVRNWTQRASSTDIIDPTTELPWAFPTDETEDKLYALSVVLDRLDRIAVDLGVYQQRVLLYTKDLREMIKKARDHAEGLNRANADLTEWLQQTAQQSAPN